MKVAFATKDLIEINDHFGWAKQFALYDVTKEGIIFLEVIHSPEDPSDEEDKINYKIASLKGAAIVYVQAIGPTAAAKVINARIHPIKISEPTTIETALAQLQTMLAGNPPPWIKRIIATEREA